MKVFVRSERGGWYLREDLGDSSKEQGKIEGPFPSYPDAVREASQRGYEINNLGWKRKLLTNVWLGHSLDRYPGWEVVRDEYPRSCGVNFKPALVPTVGVEFLPGYQNQEGIVAEARKLRGLLSDLVSVVRCREDTGPALLAAELHLKKTDGMPDLQEIELYFNPRDPSGLTALVTRIVEVSSRRVEMNPADEMDARFQVRDLLLAYAKEGRS